MSRGNNEISLRALEPEDLDTLYQYENNREVWRVSGTSVPLSRHILRRFIDSAFADIYESGQVMLMICDRERAIGTVDIFDFDSRNSRAGVGIIIFESEDRGKGYASRAIDLLIEYAFSTLLLHQLYCNILVDNTESIALFKKRGFEEIGIKKDWIKVENGFQDEIMMQIIKK